MGGDGGGTVGRVVHSLRAKPGGMCACACVCVWLLVGVGRMRAGSTRV